MSTWKRLGEIPPPLINGGVVKPEPAPLFLNTADKSPSPSPRPRDNFQQASSSLVAAIRLIAYRQLDAADTNNDSDARSRGNQWLVRASRIESCDDAAVIPYRCKNGHKWEVRPRGCGIRLCPHCERRASFHVQERLSFLMAGFRGPVRMLTLTLRNFEQGGLADMLKELTASFRRFRNSRVWKSKVDGAVAVYECTVSEERGWHAHLHIAFDGRFLPWQAALEAWTKATRGLGQRVWISGQRFSKASACKYLSKYASKGVKVRELPEELVSEFAEAWWRFRTLRTYGSLYRMKFEKFKGDGVIRCPQCGEEGHPVSQMAIMASGPELRPTG